MTASWTLSPATTAAQRRPSAAHRRPPCRPWSGLAWGPRVWGPRAGRHSTGTPSGWCRATPSQQPPEHAAAGSTAAWLGSGGAPGQQRGAWWPAGTESTPCQTRPQAPGAQVALQGRDEVTSATPRVRIPGGVRGALSLPQAPWVVGTEGYRRGSWAGGPSTARHPAALHASVGVRGMAQPHGSTARGPRGGTWRPARAEAELPSSPK